MPDSTQRHSLKKSLFFRQNALPSPPSPTRPFSTSAMGTVEPQRRVPSLRSPPKSSSSNRAYSPTASIMSETSALTTITSWPSGSQHGQSLCRCRAIGEFRIMKEIGNGSFGSVYQAQHQPSGELVAIKKMKKRFGSQGECRSLQEIKALENLRSGPNIVRLWHFFLDKKELYMVFELMDSNLYQMMKDRNGVKLEEPTIRSMVFQVLRGLQHMHSKGIMHRDMKPENLLVTGGTVKIADLGLARDRKSRPPYTTYVSTRWYRAPEVLLRSSNYSYAIDLWAIGTIAAELTCLKPLFPGNSDVDQVNRICGVLGNPTPGNLMSTTTALTAPDTQHIGIGGEWKEGVQLAGRMGFAFPTAVSRPLNEAIPNASEESLELITRLLQFDPKRRATAYQGLHCPWFKDIADVDDLQGLLDVQDVPKRWSLFSGLRSKANTKRESAEVTINTFSPGVSSATAVYK